ncbi:MAG: thiamine diphosphokinase [Bacteroidia bacterium]|nr:thiamine diphosphokinase [Bacteroidota bacterium]MCZ2130830.1 thiamine diphosphokinase [Bacteroidia bacterium]
MSSHLFVKEGQEPVLVLANGMPCSSDLLNQLVEWSPSIMVLDGAYFKAMARNIRFDILLGDFDSLGTLSPELPFPAEIIHTPDQEKTDLHKGIELLIERKTQAANLLWATGARADHFMSNLNVMARFRNEITLKMIDDHSVIYPIKSPFKKYFRAGENLSLIPLKAVRNINTRNLQYEISQGVLEPGGRFGSSNKVKESGLVEISFDDGILLLMECKD